ncbi:basement membrane-specific heparan sulfate proteoglycan core protein-like isoform X2 [Dendronephthya gigantea]|uniref:basement membrane-specific heparan sulfate proteoglycan core protein-like isoform X2 n=1 Tax=Dendronephthya gigantea TaxID=151771 RepID=UPI00106C819B|nr:basement membrane-specific heparan sulfate proteoglycan core protein-like isoform X2 [Dendronephthya gigantea]
MSVSYTKAICMLLVICTLSAKSEVAGNRNDGEIVSTGESTYVPRRRENFPDILLKGMIIIKIRTLSFIRELSYRENNLTRRLTALCEREMAKLFSSVKGKQTVKVESFRRGRWSAVVVVMTFDSTGNGNMSEITEIVEKKIKDPGRFINYDVDRRMASFRPQGVFCHPRVHYAFESSTERDIFDDSGYDNNGVIYGNIATTRHGKCGKAGRFRNGYIYLRKFKKTKTSETDTILVAFWMRIINPRSTTSLFRGYYKGAVVELFMKRGILTWKFITRREAVAFLVRHTKLLRARQWTHIVALYDPFTHKAKLYVDSELSSEVDVRKGMVRWRFTSSLRFGMTSAEGYLDDLYVYDCVLGEEVLEGIRKDCWCQELCAPRGENEFLIRMILLSTNTSRDATEQIANAVKAKIIEMFSEISGEQRVQTIGYRPLDEDSIMVDYSLQSIGNSDTRYLAGVMQPAITSGNIAGVPLASNDVSFVQLSGKGVCLSNEMKCGDGGCIDKLWRCDGEINCPDGSDEIDCGQVISLDCHANEFTCNKSRVLGISDCVEARYRCDGQLDCDDDSDEQGCVSPKLITAPRSFLIVAAGETAICRCVASGVPHPKISWYHEGAKVSSLQEKVSVTSVSGYGKLTIHNVRPEDSGDYICKISDNRIRKTIAPSCTIKVRALGNVCRPPFFNSMAQQNDQCLRCFCHGHTSNCRSAQLYRSKLTSYWDCYSCTRDDEPTLVDAYGTSVNVYQTSNTPLLYWKLPTIYSGNKLTSYGGKFEFTFDSNNIQNGARRSRRNLVQTASSDPAVWNYVRETPNKKSWLGKSGVPRTKNDVPSRPASSDSPGSASQDLNLTEGHGVFIVGNDGTHLASINLDYVDDDVFGISVTEKNWKEIQRRRTANRSTLLRVLSDIKFIFIKASSAGDIVSRLLRASLDTAVEEESGGNKITLVEHCACPIGYGGFSCEKCLTGYFREQGSQTCVKCSCNNHSSTCHPETGKCENCAHSTDGFNCELCALGYYGNATKGTSRDCKKCDCPLTVETNLFSESCYLDTDGKSTCTSCKQGYAGRNCEICAQGYEGDPRILGKTCYKVGNFSQCNAAGSVSQSTTTDGEIQCTCKRNVIGSVCDKCQEGRFNLQTSNPSGCESCYCSRKSRSCTNLIGSKFTIQTSFLEDDFKIDTVHSTHIFPHSVRKTDDQLYLQSFFSGVKIRRSLFWHLPLKFAGSKVASYGGYLEYTVTYSWNGTTKPFNYLYDVILLGKGFGIVYVGRQLRGIEYENGKKVTYKIPLLEKLWRFSSNSRVSKAVFVVFLGRIHKLLILATPYTDMVETRLHEVKMDARYENAGGVEIPGIERCSCPKAYTGYSCESCADGYTFRDSSILGRCVKCNCHGHSSNCHPQTGVCQDCQHNTTGENCEKCPAGFYGNPKAGSPCHSCPCPRVDPVNSPGTKATCFVDNEGDPVCNQCPKGHEGKLCDRCKEGFTGNPEIPGEVCKPVSSCGCNYAGTKRCDERTRRCVCKENVEGEKCSRCKAGFYNLQEKNEDGCTPCFCMGFSTTCRVLNNSSEIIKFLPSLTLPDGLVVTTEDFSRNSSDLEVDSQSKRIRFLNKTWLEQSNVYWRIPKIFLGNKVLYYGGMLSFFYSFHSSVNGNPNYMIMKGNGQTLRYKQYTHFFPNTERNFELLLHESRWVKPDSSRVTREEFMSVLVHIDAILIPVSYSRQASESRLGDIILTSASQTNKAMKPEICVCPRNTEGSSCESCVPGYTRNGRLTAECAPCECHSHSSRCDQRTGTCENCKDNTAGKHCEICAQGFYGNAKNRRRNVCKECPCPLPGSSNRFSETCFLDEDGLPTCDACLEGYSGRRCERCSLNYTGNPSTPGGKCFKVPVELIPKLKIIPESLTVQEGDNAEFVCNVQSPRPTQIIWSKRDGEALSKRATVSGVSGNVLSFRTLNISDGGTYVCTASNDMALRTAKSLLVVKKQQLSAVIVDVSPKSRYIPVGGRAKFSCTSKTSSRYSITWSREHGLSLPSSSHVKDGTLIITDARLNDGGTYICTGKNALNVDRAIISLHVGVVVKPQVSVTPRKRIVDVADTVKFRCSASAGFPAATLRWERGDGRRLPRFSKFFSRTGVFKILAASRRDEGEYMCTASNTGGESVMRVQLLVRGPNSSPKANIRPRHVTVTEGEDAILRCDVSGEEPMDIRWQKRGGELSRTAMVRRNYLEIKKTTVRDRGHYRCIARNKYGQDSALGSLFVNEDRSMLPQVAIRPPGNVISVMEGEALNLLCEVAADDRVESVKWTRQSIGGVLSRNFELNFVRMKIDDTGVYECTAKTEKGEGKASVSVVVQRNDILPSVQVRPSYVTIRLGGSVTIECTVSSTLPVTVTWSRADGSPLNNDYLIKNTVISIRDVKKEDQGTYICVAENTFGASKATLDIVISEE